MVRFYNLSQKANILGVALLKSVCKVLETVDIYPCCILHDRRNTFILFHNVENIVKQLCIPGCVPHREKVSNHILAECGHEWVVKKKEETMVWGEDRYTIMYQLQHQSSRKVWEPD